MVKCTAPSLSPSGGLPTPGRDGQIPANRITNSTQRAEQRTPRGLELIKSCAKFYANGIEVPQSANRSSPTGPTFNLRLGIQRPLRRAKPKSRIIAACLLSLVLPFVTLAGIVWWGTKIGSVRVPHAEFHAGAEPSQSVSATDRPLDVADGTATLANANQSRANDNDIVVHRVKTQRIPGVLGRPGRERDDAIETSTGLGSLR